MKTVAVKILFKLYYNKLTSHIFLRKKGVSKNTHGEISEGIVYVPRLEPTEISHLYLY